MQSLVGKKPGSREETKHQDRNSWGGKEEGEQALKPQNQRQSHPAAGRSLSERDSQTWGEVWDYICEQGGQIQVILGLSLAV